VQVADPQQNPSRQWPLMHCVSALQTAPFGWRLVHEYPRHMNPGAQSATVVHVVLHATRSQTYGAQFVGVCRQTPAPSHVPTGVAMDPLQDCVPQLVPAGTDRQAPEPSQVPLNPQGGLATQPPCGSIAPAGIGLQLPAPPATLQALQVVQLVDEQQTPSTQLPLSHSLPAAQSWPRRLSPHMPPLQTLPDAQSPLPAQAALHVVPLHA